MGLVRVLLRGKQGLIFHFPLLRVRLVDRYEAFGCKLQAQECAFIKNTTKPLTNLSAWTITSGSLIMQ